MMWFLSKVGEAAICTTLEKLMSFSSAHIPKIFGDKQAQVLAEIKMWKTLLGDLSGFLRDAEVKDQSGWLRDIVDLAHDAEDIIDGFHYKVLRHQIEFTEQGTDEAESSSKRSKPDHFDIIDQINKITKRLNDIEKRKRRLNLITSQSIRCSTYLASRSASRAPSGPLPTGSKVFGRDNDIKSIVRMIRKVSQDGGEQRIGVIPICGMGGLGKTTLARCVYNKIGSCFDIKAWVCVSSEYDTSRITKDILHEVSSGCGDLSDKSLPWIQSKIHDTVSSKKCLFVFDDLWNNNYNDWNQLQSPFSEVEMGSIAIVTTRSKDVVDTVKTENMVCINLSLLSEKHCRSLLLAHAGLVADANSFSEFEDIGNKIVVKCHGLPLAAKSVGGLLRNKDTIEKWEGVLNTMSNGGDPDVFQVLNMSYKDLNSQLQRCFAFFALFPEDSEFEEGEVVRLWLGAGLLDSVESERHKSLVGHEFFQDLVSRSLITPTKHKNSEGCKLFEIHDLVLDLARKINANSFYLAEGGEKSIKFSLESTRHLSFHPSRMKDICNTIMKSESNTPLALRTFWIRECWETQVVMDGMFWRLKYVRVLILSNLGKLPDCIGEMIHLRHLDVSGCEFSYSLCCQLYNLQTLICQNVKKLPENFGNLRKLYYLDISGNELDSLPNGIENLTDLCYLNVSRTNIKDLPERIEKLVNLRYLRLCGCSKLICLPEGIGKLVNLCELDLRFCSSMNDLSKGIKECVKLEKLPVYKIGGGDALSWLGKLKHLRGHLNILGLENATSSEEARLIEKKLRSLVLNWSLKYDLEKRYPSESDSDEEETDEEVESEDEEVESENEQVDSDWEPEELTMCEHMDRHKEMLENLQPHESLKCLQILHYGGSSLPLWLLGSCLRHLTLLRLYKCRNCTTRLTLNAMSIRKIKIDLCPRMTIFLTRLPALKDLQINGCKTITLSRLSGLSRLKIHRSKTITLSRLSVLKVLQISDGKAVSLSRLPALKKLGVKDCRLVKCIDPFSIESVDYYEIGVGIESMSPLFREKLRQRCHYATSISFETDQTFCDSTWKLADIKLIPHYPNEEMSVEELKFYGQHSLEHLPQWVSNAKLLRKILIIDCSSLKTVFSFGNYPRSLRSISIRSCKSLTSLFPQDDLLVEFPIDTLKIQNCHLLVHKLPEMWPNLTSLTFLMINYFISDYLRPILRLQLPSLRTLHLGMSEGLTSFPPEGMELESVLLTQSIIQLCLFEFPNLKVLSSSRALGSLTFLNLHGCPVLDSFPDEGLPQSIEALGIFNCRCVEKMLTDGDEQIRSKISHILDIRLHSPCDHGD